MDDGKEGDKRDNNIFLIFSGKKRKRKRKKKMKRK